MGAQHDDRGHRTRHELPDVTPDGVEERLLDLVRRRRAGEVRRLLEAHPASPSPLVPACHAWSDLTLDAATDVSLTDAARAALDAADEALGEHPESHQPGSPPIRAAVDRAALALDVLFHRELHSDDADSPLVHSPATFLEPLRSSHVGRALTGPLPVGAAETDAVARPGTSTDAAVLTGPFGSFHAPVVRALTQADGITTRTVRPDELLPGMTSTGVDAGLVRSRLEAGLGIGGPDQAVRPLLEALAGADVVLADWAGKAAAIVSWYLPRSVRLVVRVHSVDALRAWLHLIDWSRVQTLVCVAEHIAGLVRDLLGQRLVDTDVHVLPNTVDEERFAPAGRNADDAATTGLLATGRNRAAPAGGPRVTVRAGDTDTAAPAAQRTVPAPPGRTLCMVGWAQKVKDPLWTLEVLARLRGRDPTWRLLLVGADFAEHSASARAYAAAFRERALRDDVCGAIEYVGFTDSLPTVLRRAGFAVTSSVREGFPVALTEAIAAGLAPVVRDWPMFAARGGARDLYGPWVVDSVAEAASRIAALGREPARRDVAARARRELLPDRTSVDDAWRALVVGRGHT